MNKNKSETKAVKHLSSKDVGITDPKARLKSLADYASSVELDHNIPPRRYYRTGVEMIKMANMYMQEGSYEHAYILYIKFLTIFVDKIRSHPQYNTVPATDRATNQQALRDVIPKAEELKKQLLEQYQAELEKYLEDEKVREKIEGERLRQEERSRLKEEEEEKNKLAALAAAKAAKTRISTDTVIPSEESKIKKHPLIPPKPLVTPSADDVAQASGEKYLRWIVRRSLLYFSAIIMFYAMSFCRIS